jgi:type II secretory pathway pseudopilin PulG
MSRTILPTRAGFSRIDVLVMMAILAVAVGIVVPAVFLLQGAEKRTQTANNLKQCALATHGVHDQFKHYPPFWGYLGQINVTTSPHRQASFFVHLLPHVESGPSYWFCLKDLDYANKSTFIFPAYLSPADYTQINDGGGSVHFAVNLRLWQSAGRTNLQPPAIDQYEAVGEPVKVRMPKTFEPDGTSNTLLFATKLQVCGANASTLINGQPTLTPANPTSGTVTEVATINGPYFGWTYATPANQALPAAHLGWQPAPSSDTCIAYASLAQAFFPRGIQVALCDGSTRSVSASVSFDAWTKALTPNGREEAPKDWND